MSKKKKGYKKRNKKHLKVIESERNKKLNEKKDIKTPDKDKKGKKQKKKEKRSIFKHPFTKILLIGALVTGASYGSYEYGKTEVKDALSPRINNTVAFYLDGQKFLENEVTESLMQADKRGFVSFVVTEVMRDELKNDKDKPFEVTKAMIEDEAMKDAETLKATGLNGEMYLQHINAQYGSPDAYQKFLERRIIQAEYAKRHGDIDRVAEDLYKDAKGHHSFTVDMALGDNEPLEVKLTPYDAVSQFGVKFLEEFKKHNVGDSFTYKTNYSNLNITIKEDLGEMDYKSFKDELLKDRVRLSAPDIQDPLYFKVAELIDSDREKYRFGTAFEINTFLQGLAELEYKQ